MRFAPFILFLFGLLYSLARAGPYISGGQGGQLPPPGKLIFFSNMVFDFVGLFLVDILVRNLSLPPQTKKPRYCPVGGE